MVTADLDDLAGLQRAFAGASGAFCVTNFWDISLPRKNWRRPPILQKRQSAPACNTLSGRHWKIRGAGYR